MKFPIRRFKFLESLQNILLLASLVFESWQKPLGLKKPLTPLLFNQPKKTWRFKHRKTCFLNLLFGYARLTVFVEWIWPEQSLIFIYCLFMLQNSHIRIRTATITHTHKKVLCTKKRSHFHLLSAEFNIASLKFHDSFHLSKSLVFHSEL